MMKIKNINVSLFKLLTCVAAATFGLQVAQAQYATGFENPPFTSGLIAGQDTWVSTAARTNARVLTATEITNQLVNAGITDPG